MVHAGIMVICVVLSEEHKRMCVYSSACQVASPCTRLPSRNQRDFGQGSRDIMETYMLALDSAKPLSLTPHTC